MLTAAKAYLNSLPGQMTLKVISLKQKALAQPYSRLFSVVKNKLCFLIHILYLHISHINVCLKQFLLYRAVLLPFFDRVEGTQRSYSKRLEALPIFSRFFTKLLTHPAMQRRKNSEVGLILPISPQEWHSGAFVDDNNDNDDFQSREQFISLSHFCQIVLRKIKGSPQLKLLQWVIKSERRAFSHGKAQLKTKMYMYSY